MSNALARQKIVILFNGRHLSYSPTVIGLYDLLSEYFEVTIIAPSPEKFDNKPLKNRNVVYLKEMLKSVDYRINKFRFALLSIFSSDFSFLRKNNFHVEIIYEYFQIKRFFKKNRIDKVIAVDFKNLFFTQLLHKKVELLSLEIPTDDVFFPKCNQENINSVIIQTQERFEHLFQDKKLRTFFIQNAPIYREFSDAPQKKGLVYCGTAWSPFGFYHCLDFIKSFPEYTLTVRGAVLDSDRLKIEERYDDLLTNQELVIDEDYLDDSQVVDYLRQFRIGFCFYNFEIDWVNSFNYYSAPSGKMFKYMAAGVPVIGVDVSGLNPVKEFDCGVLIKDLSPKSIKAAIDTIEQNFDYYSANCLKAAKHFSFDKAAKPFIQYLLEYDKNRAHHRSNRSGRSISV